MENPETNNVYNYEYDLDSLVNDAKFWTYTENLGNKLYCSIDSLCNLTDTEIEFEFIFKRDNEITIDFIFYNLNNKKYYLPTNVSGIVYNLKASYKYPNFKGDGMYANYDNKDSCNKHFTHLTKVLPYYLADLKIDNLPKWYKNELAKRKIKYLK